MKTLSEILQLNPEEFFEYTASIRYGYKDQSGGLHFPDDESFSVYEYAFSSCEEVVANNCAWCWEIAELTKRYCIANNIPYHSWFMEYRSEELHQTHSQVFILYQGKWCPAPDNSLGFRLGEHSFTDPDSCVHWFTEYFSDYLKDVLKDRYDQNRLLVKEYTCDFMAGITDEEYLTQIRL